MLSNKKIMLLEAWKSNPFAEFSTAEIMALLKKKSKPWVFNALTLLTKNNLLIKRRKSNLHLYSLKLYNPLLIQTMQYLEAQNIYDFSQLNIITETINRIPLKTYCLLVFGSYASNTHTQKSDLDICLLIEKKTIEKKIKPYLNEIKLSHAIDIDEHYITFDDFIKMLLRDEENLGKQIFKNHKLFFNVDIYYQLIKEAYKNGFRQQRNM